MENSAKKRGFAAMDKALVSVIAQKGGRAAHAKGTAHEFSSEEAKTAGKKGGEATRTKKAMKQQEMFDPAGDAALAPEGIDGVKR